MGGDFELSSAFFGLTLTLHLFYSSQVAKKPRKIIFTLEDDVIGAPEFLGAFFLDLFTLFLHLAQVQSFILIFTGQESVNWDVFQEGLDSSKSGSVTIDGNVALLAISLTL